MSSEPIQTNEEANTSSSLAETYPKLLNSVLNKIPLSDTDSVSWILGENHFKVFGYNWNALTAILFIVMLLTPVKYMWFWALWIGAEFFASFDIKNTVKFSILTLFATLVRLLINKKRYGRVR
jgi:hypothetical protein